jgi:hypothetical protein
MKTPMQELIETLKELQETQDPTLRDAILRDAIELFTLIHGQSPYEVNAEGQRLEEVLLEYAITFNTK